MVARIVVPGRPVPLARPRVTGRGTYLPARSREYRERCRVAWLEAGRPTFGDQPLRVAMLFELPRPRRAKPVPCGRPDVSNLAKAVEDALDGLAWRDDAQIVTLSASKVWGDPPGRTIVTIMGAGGA